MVPPQHIQTLASHAATRHGVLLLLLQGDSDVSYDPDSPTSATWAGTPGRTYTYGELAAATQAGPRILLCVCVLACCTGCVYVCVCPCSCNPCYTGAH